MQPLEEKKLTEPRELRDKLVKFLESKQYKVRVIGLHELKIAEIEKDEVILLDISLTPQNKLKECMRALELIRESLFEKCKSDCRLIGLNPKN